MSSNFIVESCSVDSEEGVKLHTRVFKPRNEGEEVSDDGNLVIVLVHPFSLLGGCQALLKGIASELASKGFKAVTFDTRGAGKSTGRATLTGFAEVKDVVAVCRWLCQNVGAHRILLVGSSAGAPIAGSAVDQVDNGYSGGSSRPSMWLKQIQCLMVQKKLTTNQSTFNASYCANYI